MLEKLSRLLEHGFVNIKGQLGWGHCIYLKSSIRFHLAGQCLNFVGPTVMEMFDPSITPLWSNGLAVLAVSLENAAGSAAKAANDRG